MACGFSWSFRSPPFSWADSVPQGNHISHFLSYLKHLVLHVGYLKEYLSSGLLFPSSKLEHSWTFFYMVTFLSQQATTRSKVNKPIWVAWCQLWMPRSTQNLPTSLRIRLSFQICYLEAIWSRHIKSWLNYLSLINFQYVHCTILL